MSQQNPNRRDIGRKPKFRRRAEARPDDILDAALKLFSLQGFMPTRMEDVAKEAGISKGAIYLYFPSKKALLEGLIRRAVVPVADSALEMIAAHRGDPLPVIRKFLTMVASAVKGPDGFAVPKLVIREAAAVPEIARMYREEVIDKALPAIAGLIAQGVEGGYIRNVDPELTVRTVVGPLFMHVLLDEVFGIRPDEGLAIDRLVDNHLTILMAGLAPETGGAR
ncbi:TetR/AcrR family transcriptional regulator [Rhizobiales bacterium]|uniref:TetR/AcrR family transcriptional regulator n=1 Tax=Hongsoonwoonella zoysiae TaxID=2821844 RepID=UPI0015616493|nr:TetR/AcrR family transcriptional regulator [Hongsoonwoonella zoysiae]NRG16290.1 TetR/AcrR family transcriptional regulator [Hongsoonwoonella zoysiae]